MDPNRDDEWGLVPVLLWVLWLVSFGLLEWWGLRKDHDRWPPLTQVFRRYVPAVIGIGVTAWLLFHAAQTYW